MVTIGMALVNKKRRKQDITRVAKHCFAITCPTTTRYPQTLKIDRYRPGPGNELKTMIAWFAKPSETCNCETRVDTMNDWGAEGCRRNIDTIVDWLLEEAQVRGLPMEGLRQQSPAVSSTPPSASSNEKFPEGAPEPDQDDPEDEFDR